MHATVLVMVKGGDAASAFEEVERALAPFDENATEGVPMRTESEDGESWTYNAQGHWDWWALGGRWPGQFILRADAPPDDGVLGERGWVWADNGIKISGDDRNPSVIYDEVTSAGPHGTTARHADLARKSAIDWEAMAALNVERARETWAKALMEPDDGMRYWNYGVSEDDVAAGEQAFLRHASNFGCYATLVDGVWTERTPYNPETRTLDEAPVDEWNRALTDAIRRADDDAWLAVVDFHS